VARLSTETVKSATGALESVDDVESSDGFAKQEVRPGEGWIEYEKGACIPFGVLGVGDRVADDVLEENLEDTAGLLVDEAGDTLHTTTTSETADSGFSDT